MREFAAEFRRSALMALRNRSELANPLAFYVMIVVLFPLGVGADPVLLSAIAGAVLWIAALLATLLSLENVFRRDLEDGALEALVLGAELLFVRVLARVSVHWMMTGLPLTLLAPLLAFSLSLDPAARVPLVAGLALGTPVLSMLGCVGAALTVSLRRGGLLLSLLVIPLYIPVLVFGVGAVVLATDGVDVSGQLLWLAVILAVTVTTAPFAIAAALWIGLES